MSGPLSGFRVLDLSRILAGPWASQMLADLGADVIKIEKPGEGDDTRGWGPPFVTNADGTRGDAAYFQSANRGKQSVCIDMATTEGQTLIKQIAEKSDVVLENFKVGGLRKYGLDYESLKSVNPRLVYCSITGFGQTGPYAQRAGYDFMIQGMGGLMSITGQPDGAPGAEPMKVGVATADILTGLHAVIGIQAALLHRERTGIGQHIDLALLDTQISALANQNLNYLVGGKAPVRLGNAHPNIVPYQTFQTLDGFIIIAVGNDRQYTEFCRIIGAHHLGNNPNYATNRSRVENRDQLIPEIRPFLLARSTQEWVDALESAAVPCGPINRIDEVFDDPQVKARGIAIKLKRRDGVEVPSVANPIRMSASPAAYEKPPPQLGEQTDEVLRDLLGATPDQLLAWRSSKVIA
jgi:crotonobetainyl-CoA:carnitine CoA-transferase CaiB-like acyl-CoA transferase